MTQAEWDCQFVFNFLYFCVHVVQRARLSHGAVSTVISTRSLGPSLVGLLNTKCVRLGSEKREKHTHTQKVPTFRGCWSQGILWLARICLAVLPLRETASLSWLQGAAATEPISPQRAKTTLQEWDNYLHSGCLTLFFIAQAVQTICCLSPIAWSGYLSGQPRGCR